MRGFVLNTFGLESSKAVVFHVEQVFVGKAEAVASNVVKGVGFPVNSSFSIVRGMPCSL